MMGGFKVGWIRFGLVWFGLVWFGLVWFGLVWFGLVALVTCSRCVVYGLATEFNGLACRPGM